MVSTILKYAAGVTTILSLISFLGGLYVWLQSQKKEKSVVDTIKGEGIVQAEGVIQILKQFNSDETRLQALQQMLGYSKDRASDVLDKVKSNVDVRQFSLDNQVQLQRRLLVTGIVLFMLAILAIVASKERAESADTMSVPFEASYPPVGGQIQHCPCIAYAVEEKGITITNNCPGPVPIMCIKDTEFIPPGPANIDILQLATGRRFAHTTIGAGKKAFFDASGRIGNNGACQYYACPGTDLQPLPLRCQVGPILPPPSNACMWPQNTGVVGQQCTCPNGAIGTLTQ